jgi:hypothetical protein
LIILFYSILYHSVLFYSVLFLYSKGISSREVEYRISNAKDVSSSPAMVTIFLWENLRKFAKNLWKCPETSGKPPKNSEDGGKLQKCKCIYAAHKQETFSAPWTVWSCGIRLYVRKSTFGVLTVNDLLYTHHYGFNRT